MLSAPADQLICHDGAHTMGYDSNLFASLRRRMLQILYEFLCEKFQAARLKFICRRKHFFRAPNHEIPADLSPGIQDGFRKGFGRGLDQHGTADSSKRAYLITLVHTHIEAHRFELG